MKKDSQNTSYTSGQANATDRPAQINKQTENLRQVNSERIDLGPAHLHLINNPPPTQV